MKSFRSILGLNLTIVLVTAVVLRLLIWGPQAGVDFSFSMAMALALHSLLLLMLALTNHPPETRSSYWLALLLVWLVGFGSCAAGASITL